MLMLMNKYPEQMPPNIRTMVGTADIHTVTEFVNRHDLYDGYDVVFYSALMEHWATSKAITRLPQKITNMFGGRKSLPVHKVVAVVMMVEAMGGSPDVYHKRDTLFYKHDCEERAFFRAIAERRLDARFECDRFAISVEKILLRYVECIFLPAALGEGNGGGYNYRNLDHLAEYVAEELDRVTIDGITWSMVCTVEAAEIFRRAELEESDSNDTDNDL